MYFYRCHSICSLNVKLLITGDITNRLRNVYLSHQYPRGTRRHAGQIQGIMLICVNVFDICVHLLRKYFLANKIKIAIDIFMTVKFDLIWLNMIIQLCVVKYEKRTIFEKQLIFALLKRFFFFGYVKYLILIKLNCSKREKVFQIISIFNWNKLITSLSKYKVVSMKMNFGNGRKAMGKGPPRSLVYRWQTLTTGGDGGRTAARKKLELTMLERCSVKRRTGRNDPKKKNAKNRSKDNQPKGNMKTICNIQISWKISSENSSPNEIPMIRRFFNRKTVADRNN